VFAVKAGIIKNKEQLLGVMLKGVDKEFDWEFFRRNLVQGEVFDFPDTVGDRVLVSEYMADKLGLEVDKKIRMFFLSEGRSRARAFTIAGIYNTGLTEGYDDKFVICDLRQVQKLNNWDSTGVAGFEVLLDENVPVDDAERLGALTDRVNDELDYELIAENIRDLTPSIFSWLDVLDTNALIIIVLMIFVGMINMISALLILIIDRTNMIGTLKAMGADSWLVMKIFLRNGSGMILRGVIAGNILGIGLCLFQKYTGLIGLDEQSYYVKVVPIHIVWTDVLLLNVCTVFICSLALLLPVLLVTKITPARALRFS
jgi:lipoprotein-releasing system permease protein